MNLVFIKRKNLVNLQVGNNSETKELITNWVISERWRRFLLSYAKSYNKVHNRSGSLFQKLFRRKNIVSVSDLRDVLIYIHHNPIHHRVCKNYHDYKWTSYQSYHNRSNSKLNREEAISWFNDLAYFDIKHMEYKKKWDQDINLSEHHLTDRQY